MHLLADCWTWIAACWQNFGTIVSVFLTTAFSSLIVTGHCLSRLPVPKHTVNLISINSRVLCIQSFRRNALSQNDWISSIPMLYGMPTFAILYKRNRMYIQRCHAYWGSSMHLLFGSVWWQLDWLRRWDYLLWMFPSLRSHPYASRIFRKVRWDYYLSTFQLHNSMPLRIPILYMARAYRPRPVCAFSYSLTN